MSNFIVIPTYNECENVEKLTHDLINKLESLKIIFVDDSSPDGTGKILDDLAQRFNTVQVIHRASKLGLGSAYTEGFKSALSQGANLIFTMDADFSHDPSYIIDLFHASSDSDIVIGSRYVAGGEIHNWGVLRLILSRCANFLAKRALKIKLYDCTSGFRCYRKEVFTHISLDSIFSDGYSYLIEMIFRCYNKGFIIKEVPISFVNRARGRSKISKKEIYKAVCTLVRLRLDIR